MKKKILVLSVIIFALALLCGCQYYGKAPQSDFKFDKISVVLPSGFKITADGGSVAALNENYPTESDNITFTSGLADSVENYSREKLDAKYQQTIAGFQGSTFFEKKQQDGFDIVIYKFDVDHKGVQMKTTQCVVFCADRINVVTFTSVSGKYDEAFQACLESLKVNPAA